MFAKALILVLPLLVKISRGQGNRDAVMNMAIVKLGVTFYNQVELTIIAKCCEPQFYATPHNNSAILQKGKQCVLQNSGNKAIQALALYTNVNNCLKPETLDSTVEKLLPPVEKLTATLLTKIRNTLTDCKSTNTQTGAAKQEACLQKTYGIGLAALTLTYVDGVCTKLVNQNVNAQQWGCAQKYLPSVVNFNNYGCSKIVK